MKQAISLVAAVAAAFLALGRVAGDGTAQTIGYGAIALMSALIAATFLWLWRERATPLALGMAFSWAGTALVIGSWWVRGLGEAGGAIPGHPFLLVFLALHAVGAVLHFGVIQRSMELHRGVFFIPVLGAFGISAALVLLS